MAHAARSSAGRRGGHPRREVVANVPVTVAITWFTASSSAGLREVVKPIAAMVSQIGPTIPAMYCSGLTASSVVEPAQDQADHAQPPRNGTVATRGHGHGQGSEPRACPRATGWCRSSG